VLQSPVEAIRFWWHLSLTADVQNYLMKFSAFLPEMKVCTAVD